MSQLTPMMQQYVNTKKQYEDCILFYRLGDFYEMFFEDAITASRELEITLTGKDCGLEERAPMCGVPFHSAESYISKLIEKGYKVAICEQLEDPKLAKGIVKRDVIRIITPGTVIEDNMLDEKRNNYIMSIFKKGTYFGIAVCDITTGEFYATQIVEENNFEKLLDELAKYAPAEIVVNEQLFLTKSEIDEIKARFNPYISKGDEKTFNEEYDTSHFTYVCAESLDSKLFAISAVNALIDYLKTTQKIELQHINTINIYNSSEYMSLDVTARKNLELTERLREKSKKGTLLWVLDNTSTSMGGRLLRKWINEPLVNIKNINKRLNAVKELKEQFILRGDLRESLKKVYDIERLISKISYGNANGKDLISLKNSISQLPNIKKLLQGEHSEMLMELYKELDTLDDVFEIIDSAIVDDPPLSIKEGELIKLGYNEELDEYKMASTEGKNWIIGVETREKERTGIKNLRVNYNKVFGYYIEVTKSYFDLVPEDYIRKQTLTNCERFITQELKEIEEKILGAQEKSVGLEYELFIDVRNKVANQIKRIQKTANAISTLDVLISFANVAEEYNYTMPIVDNEGEIDIKEGRHPVIEKMLPAGTFVNNDTYMNNDSDRFSLITGPNMAGKSTYMRQVAIITLMAQIGSFVPASYAKIGIVDKIFTRIGASDDLSMGQSTFMVEMMEVAAILKNCTKNSLVILDEIGRGTSTYDGLSIAWAVVEYIANKEKCGAKTLFATHYHELTVLEDKIEGIKNYSVAVKESGEDVIFLRKIIPGGTDESYGIHVAKLAGVAKPVIKRANEILKNIEKKSVLNTSKKEIVKDDGQLNMYNYKLAEIAHEIDKINLNELTPINALNILEKIKQKMEQKIS